MQCLTIIYIFYVLLHKSAYNIGRYFKSIRKYFHEQNASNNTSMSEMSAPYSTTNNEVFTALTMDFFFQNSKML